MENKTVRVAYCSGPAVSGTVIVPTVLRVPVVKDAAAVAGLNPIMSDLHDVNDMPL